MTQGAKTAVLNALENAPVSQDIAVISTPGFCEFEGICHFVYYDGTILGPNADQIYLGASFPIRPVFSKSGTFSREKGVIAEYAGGQALPTFLLGYSLTPLVQSVLRLGGYDLESTICELTGKSGIGKTRSLSFFLFAWDRTPLEKKCFRLGTSQREERRGFS